MAADALTVKSLCKSFSGNKILAEVSFCIKEGELDVILGPSGCGKTTLLRIIAGLETPSSGLVRIEEKVDSRIGFVFQGNCVFPWRTVQKNIEFGLEAKNISERKRKETAKRYINLMNLHGYEKYYPHELSGGMQQRLKLAMCLSVNPSILLMDESFNSLDYFLKMRLQDELLDIWKETKKTIIMVTHDIDEAIYLADRIIILSKKPSRVLTDLKVELPKPRKRNSIEFVQFKERILKILKFPDN
jgi:ABC-type nitrate/sulfonate/bicarbonate transport system ATPase subunit